MQQARPVVDEELSQDVARARRVLVIFGDACISRRAAQSATPARPTMCEGFAHRPQSFAPRRVAGDPQLANVLRHMLIGYARVSKTDGSQSLDLQRDALGTAGVDAVQRRAESARPRPATRFRATGIGNRSAVAGTS